MESTGVLYISYDGMTDNLGQSQVIPYLQGLSEKGYSIHLLSCEKHMSLQNINLSDKAREYFKNNAANKDIK